MLLKCAVFVILLYHIERLMAVATLILYSFLINHHREFNMATLNAEKDEKL